MSGGSPDPRLADARPSFAAVPPDYSESMELRLSRALLRKKKLLVLRPVSAAGYSTTRTQCLSRLKCQPARIFSITDIASTTATA